VAIKQLHPGSSAKEYAELIEEVKVLEFVGKHENIVNFFGCTVDPQDGW